MVRSWYLAGVLIMCVAAGCAGTAPGAEGGPDGRPIVNEGPRKKLILHGQGTLDPSYLRDHPEVMEKLPFDGMVFPLKGASHNVFEPVRWDESRFAADFEALPKIRWGKFTHNFVDMLISGGLKSPMDWFNDEHWEAITHNVGLMAKGARLGRCVGMAWDPEAYGAPGLFRYKEHPDYPYPHLHRDTKSFDEYAAKVRERGGQFVKAIQRELPNARILLLKTPALWEPLLAPMSPEERKAKIREESILMLSFYMGIIEAAAPGVVIIDGNEEGSYWATKREEFLEGYHRMKQRALVLVDPALRDKYCTQVQAGQAVYANTCFGRTRWRPLHAHMTPEGMAKFYEHNIYWALYTADEYAWVWHEGMNWFTGEGVPAGAEEAARSACQKLAEGRPLGIDTAPILAAARERAAEKAQLREATIARLPQGTPAPRIDGALDDKAWGRTEALPPFVPLPGSVKPVALTQARLTYNEDALFVALRCEEPSPDEMTVVGEARDSNVWAGDAVEIMISTPGKTAPFYHFVLNPKGAAYDSINPGEGGKEDLTYNPEWQHVTHIGPDFWTAEMAIPWRALQMDSPKDGRQLRANLCRIRPQGHDANGFPMNELSCWSPMAKWFLDHHLFGTWVFK